MIKKRSLDPQNRPRARHDQPVFLRSSVSKGVISYGVSSYGYDLRVADEFKVLRM